MTDNIDIAGVAWLHRHGKRTWQFSQDPKYGELVHITPQGTVYAILSGHEIGKPFWIGRLVGRAWLTCEGRLRVRSIEFDNGDEYVFN